VDCVLKYKVKPSKYVCSLFIHHDNKSVYETSNVSMTINDKLKWMCKQSVAGEFLGDLKSLYLGEIRKLMEEIKIVNVPGDI
jgi:hypothetical protein